MPTVVERIPTTPILSYHQRDDLHSERETLQEQIRNPNIQDKGNVRKAIARIDKQLISGSPPEVRPEEREELKKESDRLLAEITHGMNTQVEQRRNPPGAVDKLIRWEKHNKPKILRWKNAVRMLEPDNPDRDLTNLERFRPPGDVVGLLNDAQIAGIHTMSPQAKANWPLGDPTSQTAIAHLAGASGDAEENQCKACGKACGEKIYCNPECRDEYHSHKIAKRTKKRRGKARFDKELKATDEKQQEKQEKEQERQKIMATA